MPQAGKRHGMIKRTITNQKTKTLPLDKTRLKIVNRIPYNLKDNMQNKRGVLVEQNKKIKSVRSICKRKIL